MVHLAVGAEVARVAAIELAAVERRIRRIAEGGVMVVAGGVELDAARPDDVLDLLAVASGDRRRPDVVRRSVVAQEAVRVLPLRGRAKARGRPPAVRPVALAKA